MICESFYKSIGLTTPKPLAKNDRIKFNRYVFQNYFLPRMGLCKLKGTYIELLTKDLQFIEDFVKKKVVAKTKEWRGMDDKYRVKRETTGSLIEYGLLKLFGKESKFDDSIVDASYKRNHPDLIPLGVVCDIKGSFINNVPLVFKTTRTYTCNVGNYIGKKYRCANLIGITDHKNVWLLGIASPKMLEEYVDDNLIMVSENTSKTGFYGADQLADIPSDWDAFKAVCSEKSLIL
jgi:hypothetical protein